jgi:hypothetical protein
MTDRLASPRRNTMKAYRQDLIAVATLIAGGDPVQLAVTDYEPSARLRTISPCRRDPPGRIL